MQNINLAKALAVPALPISIVRNADGLFIISTSTGEILEQETLAINVRPLFRRHISKYVGIDTRFPAQSRNADELSEAVEVHDSLLHDLNVNYEGLLGLLGDSLRPSEVLVFRYLCEHLTAWNYWIGTHDDLSKAFPNMSRSALFQALRVLESGLVRRCREGRRGRLMFKVHPWYAFKGAIYFQQPALENWCRVQSIGSLQNSAA